MPGAVWSSRSPSGSIRLETFAISRGLARGRRDGGLVGIDVMEETVARIPIQMAKLGYDMETGRIAGWSKHVGDTVQRGDVVAEVRDG